MTKENRSQKIEDRLFYYHLRVWKDGKLDDNGYVKYDRAIRRYKRLGYDTSKFEHFLEIYRNVLRTRDKLNYEDLGVSCEEDED